MNETQLIDFVRGWRLQNGIGEQAPLTEAQVRQFATDLQARVAEFSVRPPAGGAWAADAQLLGYSGKVGAAEGFQVADFISTNSGGKVYYVSDTAAGKLLNSDLLKNAVAENIGGLDPNNASYGELMKDRIFSGQVDPISETRTSRYSFGNLLSLDDFVSLNAVNEGVTGDFKVLAPKTLTGSVLIQTEVLDAAFAKAEITSINGVPKNLLISVYESVGASSGDAAAAEAVGKMIQSASAARVVDFKMTLGANGEITGLDTGDFFKGSGVADLRLLPGATDVTTVRDSFRFETEAQKLSWAEGYANLDKGVRLGAGAGYLQNVLLWGGGALVVYDWAQTVDQAKALAAAGDPEGARTLMLRWTLQTEAGILAGAAAAELVGTFFSPLLATPTGYSQIAWVGLTALAALGGGILGVKGLQNVLGNEAVIAPTVDADGKVGAPTLQFGHAVPITYLGDNGLEVQAKLVTVANGVQVVVTEQGQQAIIVPLPGGKQMFLGPDGETPGATELRIGTGLFGDGPGPYFEEFKIVNKPATPPYDEFGGPIPSVQISKIYKNDGTSDSATLVQIRETTTDLAGTKTVVVKNAQLQVEGTESIGKDAAGNFFVATGDASGNPASRSTTRVEGTNVITSSDLDGNGTIDREVSTQVFDDGSSLSITKELDGVGNVTSEKVTSREGTVVEFDASASGRLEAQRVVAIEGGAIDSDQAEALGRSLQAEDATPEMILHDSPWLHDVLTPTNPGLPDGEVPANTPAPLEEVIEGLRSGDSSILELLNESLQAETPNTDNDVGRSLLEAIGNWTEDPIVASDPNSVASSGMGWLDTRIDVNNAVFTTPTLTGDSQPDVTSDWAPAPDVVDYTYTNNTTSNNSTDYYTYNQYDYWDPYTDTYNTYSYYDYYTNTTYNSYYDYYLNTYYDSYSNNNTNYNYDYYTYDYSYSYDDYSTSTSYDSGYDYNSYSYTNYSYTDTSTNYSYSYSYDSYSYSYSYDYSYSYSYSYYPVVLDLDGNGVQLVESAASTARFDLDHDGVRERAGWVSAGDGLIAYDHDHNGIITRSDEIELSGYKTGATSDLEGLSAFDTNNNNLLDAGDAKWADFGVWRDANQDGISQAGEFVKLSAAGITSISLTRTGSARDQQGAHILGDVTYTTSDGLQHAGVDVGLVGTTVDSPAATTACLYVYALDLDGNGVSTKTKADAGVLFDVDNDGFGEAAAWLNSGDGMLAVDWNGDGKINSASELVTTQNTESANAGSNRMNLLDTQGDGTLDANDAAFSQLRVWRDMNGDGLSAAAEIKTLAELGITSIDYLEDTYTADGVNRELAAVQLDADAQGVRIDQVVGGIRLQEEGGETRTYFKADNGLVMAHESGENDGTIVFYATASVTLNAGVNDLVLLGSGNIDGTGNALNNNIAGNAGANRLYGGLGNDNIDGGAGADEMHGGGGNDLYYVDNVGDVVAEIDSIGGGIDTVQSCVTYTLAAGVEHLTLTDGEAINGTGNAMANIFRGNDAANVLTGLGGNDTYYIDQSIDTVVEAAGQGIDTVISSITLAMADNVETLQLTGQDDLDATGNALDNSLVGNDGDNLLDGGAGADAMAGGAGDDSYIVDNTGDTVTENASEGTDLVQSSVSFTLSANVENLTLTGTGAINGTGNALDNVLLGNTGANVLAGGGGNDAYYVGTGDTVVENANEGADCVYSDASFTLGANVEDLTLTGSGNLNGTGNASNNLITGNSGNNVLDGGAGADTLIGGAGNDTYVVDNAGDTVTENANEGTDLVQSSVSITLGANVENLTLTGSGNINGTGNSLNNAITGNSGNNVLDGGAGADTMTGGAGDDTYYVDDAGDTVTENAGQGTDTVQSAISYTLGANVENLTLAGSANLNGTGNALNNVLIGNSGANALAGGAGNDTYVVDNAGDTVTENAAEGTDLVQSSVSWTLGANVENLTLTGSGNVNGTGNAANNMLVGNTGGNSLDGGAGTDWMWGGAGNDTYVVDNAGDVVTEALTTTTTYQWQNQYYWNGAQHVSNWVQVATGTSTLAPAAGVAPVYSGGTSSSYATEDHGNWYLQWEDHGHYEYDGEGGSYWVPSWVQVEYWGSSNVQSEVSRTVVTAGDGTDAVSSSVSHALTYGVENLTLTGSGNINGTGNSLNNVLNGNSGNNVLDGGAGADAMVGSAGNDTYIVDNASDTVTENAAEGTDLVQSSASFTLGANIENLTLTGSAAINGTGNALDNVLVGNSGANVLAGGGGNDTYYVGAGDTVVENANEGTDNVYSDASFTLGANVENLTLTGSGNLNGTGNASNNLINGNSGNNVLDGGAGADQMAGGVGNDTYVVDNAGDTVTENAAEGTDLVQSSVSFTLGTNIENLTLTGSGNVNGTGNAANNVLVGNTGGNSLDGGAGTDWMWGGAGNDTYVVDNAGDVVTEALTTTTTYQWQNQYYWNGAQHVSNWVQVATGTSTLAPAAGVAPVYSGGTSSSYATEDHGNWYLQWEDHGHYEYDGEGGSYWVPSWVQVEYWGSSNVQSEVSRTVVTAGDGTDAVSSSVSHALTYGVENLTLTGAADINATGNAATNVLTGNAGNNVLDGGAGADQMAGGAGNDTYVVDNASDTVTENAAEGTDLVQSSGSFTLGANIENLTLTGSAAINGTGNALDNVLLGNTGANVLTGGGGNDTYYVGAGDTVVENANEGTDNVYSDASFTLGANVENLTLTGSANLNGTGNASNNLINGNSGNNVLDGGAGADQMAGGVGNDTYVVDNAGDTVTENAAEGTDLVQSSVSWTLGANVENLTLTGSGNVNGTGNAANNMLVGNTGGNSLDGGAGTDWMWGGSGNDSYVVDNAGDVVTEAVTTTTTYQWQNQYYWNGAQHVSNWVQVATGTSTLAPAAGVAPVYSGGTTSTYATQDHGNWYLQWEDHGHYEYDGEGGSYWVPSWVQVEYWGSSNVQSEVSRTVVTAGDGTDAVSSSVSHTLTYGVENLTLTGAADINATGNELANILTGNSGGNVLNGGTGNDTLAGGLGNDVYQFDAGFGVDTVSDSGGTTDIVRFGAGISPSGVAASRSGMDLRLTNGANQVTVQNWYSSDANKTERAEFADGTVWTATQLRAMTDLAPTVANPIADQAVTEDAAFSFTVPANAFADADAVIGDTLSYSASLASGAALPAWLSFDAVTRTFTGTPPNPNGAPVSVRVTATDAVGASVSDVFDLNIANTNDAPTNVALSASTVAENAPNATIGTLSTTDQDLGDTFTYSIVAGGDGAQFAISGNTLKVGAGGLDYEAGAARTLTVRSTDAAGAFFDKALTVNVTNVNEAPANIGLSANTVAENAPNATIGTLSSTDPDAGNTFTYSIVAGGDGAQFAITGNTLKVGASGLDYEAGATRTVTVRSTDQGGLTFDKTFSVNVTNVNEAPTNVALSASSVAENAANATIGTLSSTDSDAGNTFTYSIVAGGDGAQFAISGNTLNVGASGLDYEAGATRTVTVRTTDQGGLTFDKTLTVNVTNVNETPTNMALSANAVGENAANATIGTLSTTDPDAGNTFTYGIVAGGDGAQFAITGNTLKVGATGLDYEAGATRTVTVRSTDQGGLTFDKTFTVNVTNANEAPTNIALSASTVAENAPNAAVGTFSTTDPDAGNTFTYSLVAGGDASQFAISGSTLAVGATGFNYEAGATRTVTVRTTDQGGLTFDKTLTVNVTNVNEAPFVASAIADQAATADVAFAFTVPANAFADVDAGTTLTYTATLASGAGLPSWLSFNAATRAFSGTPAGSDVGLLNVRVRATDQPGLSVSDDFDLNVSLSGIQGTSGVDSLVGTAADERFYAFAGNDIVQGLGGADLLDGGTGVDQLWGGAGNDTYVVDNAGDVVTEAVTTTTTYQWQNQYYWNGAQHVSNWVQVATGTSTLAPAAGVAPVYSGGTTSTYATQDHGNWYLQWEDHGHYEYDGEGGSYWVPSWVQVEYWGSSNVQSEVSRTIVTAGDGIDSVSSSVSHTLTYGVENLTLTGSAAINGTGNALDNVLVGNTGANVLAGGAGNDTYYVGTGDTVVENANEGTDNVYSDASFTLGANVENLTLTGSGNINGTGNSLNNVITGNSGNNVLAGGAGNDTYVLDPTDTVVENAGEGVDTIQIGISYTLGATLENLTLTGSADLNGTGNAANNVIIGNAGSNLIDGGAGADAMSGGAGNDTYVVDNAADTVTENANEGTDLVQSSASFTLGANVENLTLTGSGNINGTGNASDNVLTGNAGNNMLSGAAGADVLDGAAGTDWMWGGSGNDSYVVDNAADVVTEALTTTTTYQWQNQYYWNGAQHVSNWVQVATGTSTAAPAAGVAPVYSGSTTSGYATEDHGNWYLQWEDHGHYEYDGEGSYYWVSSWVQVEYWGSSYVQSEVSRTIVTAGDGTDSVSSSVSQTLTYGVENLTLTGSGDINGTGNAASNYIRGNSGNNVLTGGAGIDVMEGGAGNDTLSDIGTSEVAFLAGGSGSDTLSGGNGREFLAGGAGNDTIHTADGSDIVAFNLGDGQDSVDSTGTAQDNMLALGGGITYANLKFSKSGNDLVLAASANDSVTLKNWYAGSKSFGTLQVVIEAGSDYNAGSGDATLNKKVERFDLTGLANRFDQERAANPSLTEWALSNALTQFHLGGSDTAALGGDLAYYLGKNGTLANMGVDKAVEVLNASAFGQQTQTIRDWATLQTGVAKLSQ